MSQSFFSKKIFKVIIIVAVFGLLVFLNPASFFSPLEKIFLGITYPFQKMFYGISYKIGKQKKFLSSIGEIKKDNEELHKRNLELESENANLRDQRSENEILRQQLGLLPREKFELESAFVIGQDPQGLGNWILIDKGSRRGIEKNMPVIVANGIYVGKVSEVYPDSAKISMLTNPVGAVNVFIGESRAKGIVKGKYGLGLMLDMVLQTEKISQDDYVITSNIAENIPQGLLVGKIQDVKTSADGLYQQSTVTPAVKLSDLYMVSLIKKMK